jgi:hypothetical protein
VLDVFGYIHRKEDSVQESVNFRFNGSNSKLMDRLKRRVDEWIVKVFDGFPGWLIEGKMTPWAGSDMGCNKGQRRIASKASQAQATKPWRH